MRIILVNKTFFNYKNSKHFLILKYLHREISYILKLSFVRLIMGHVVEQLVEALR